LVVFLCFSPSSPWIFLRSLHDALPIFGGDEVRRCAEDLVDLDAEVRREAAEAAAALDAGRAADRPLGHDGLAEVGEDQVDINAGTGGDSEHFPAEVVRGLAGGVNVLRATLLAEDVLNIEDEGVAHTPFVPA